MIAKLRSAPQILYPAINEANYLLPEKSDGEKASALESLLQLKDKKLTGKPTIITSLNRYERKKNINLALESFATYAKMPSANPDSILVIAGGYDDRLPENVEHHTELVELAARLEISNKVVFLRSISNEQRVMLLTNTDILLYTPENEHFGIVPVEAMHLGCIVIACDSGGPLESIKHGETGFLRKPDSAVWAQ